MGNSLICLVLCINKTHILAFLESLTTLVQMASEKSPMCDSLREQRGDEAGLAGQSVTWNGALSQPSASMRLIWKMGCADYMHVTDKQMPWDCKGPFKIRRCLFVFPFRVCPNQEQEKGQDPEVADILSHIHKINHMWIAGRKYGYTLLI